MKCVRPPQSNRHGSWVSFIHLGRFKAQATSQALQAGYALDLHGLYEAY